MLEGLDVTICTGGYNETPTLSSKACLVAWRHKGVIKILLNAPAERWPPSLLADDNWDVGVVWCLN